MELSKFVEESLKQILKGVKQAQTAENGENINAEGANVPDGKNVYSAGTFGTFTIVEFDIAVSAETSGKGGANLQVFGVGFEGGGEHKAGHANRIGFAIPVRLPDGDKTRAQGVLSGLRSNDGDSGNW